jgi:hypothetical protein
MSAAESQDNRNPIVRFLTSEIVLGTLIAVLSILTAVASYQGSISDSAEGDHNVEAQKILADSNADYLRANQDIIYDYDMFDGFFLYEGEDDFRSEYYRESFSDELNTAMERDEDNPFDDAYYEDMFTFADETYDQAMGEFAAAQEAGDKADQLQMVMLIMAVGLSFAAWASLLGATSNMRLLFAIMSIVALVLGLITYIPTL